MLSFIRKRLPSKDRSTEHLQHVKSNHNQDEHQNDDEIKRSQSTNELDNNNNNEKKKQKKKKKNKFNSSSTVDALVHPSTISSTSETINKSYSDVDYFPMMCGTTSQSNKHDKTSTNNDCSSDCYLNPSDILQTKSDINYVQTKPRVFQIPVIDCRYEDKKLSYKHVDHQRTKVLQQLTEQRIQKKLIKLRNI
ncbi:unnamed protein product [Adineta steineri]|uniref:Uncharacterized protein n=1 Tax=Adineta steineri TaxID=433720 RepID=A0A815IHP1_9BILA|nr:unnamed protein product [Adineta steineri]CAF3531179.1 unnamed protein product [Adineta steineri]